jgi:hypothetical protein
MDSLDRSTRFVNNLLGLDFVRGILNATLINGSDGNSDQAGKGDSHPGGSHPVFLLVGSVADPDHFDTDLDP